MRALTATGTVRADHTLLVPIPQDIPPGQQTVIVVFEESVAPNVRSRPLQLTPHQTGPTDSACTYRREDIYGDDGR